MKTSPLRLAVLLALAAGVPSAFAPTAFAAGLDSEPQAVAPLYLQDTQPADDSEVLDVVVKEIVGKVSVSTDDGKTWKLISVGEKFSRGVRFRTAISSGVTCSVGTDQMFTLESLTSARVDEAIRRGNSETAELSMRYGAASYGIERAGKEYDTVIRTPGATMSIGGTVVRLVNRPGFSPTAESYTGRALFRTARGSTFIGGRTYSVASAVQGSAAETALDNSSIDPSIAAARTRTESQVIAEQVSQGAVLGFDQRASIPVVRGGGPLDDAQLPGALPGRLSFALRWDGPADLNFIVDNQAGDQTSIILGGFRPEEILYPGYGLNVSTSGGVIPFDHRGGKNGGTEIAYWNDKFPTGVYGVGVLHASGGTTDFKINAFLDKEPLPIITFDAEGNLVRFNTLRGTVGPNGSDGAILFVPRNPLFEGIALPGDDDSGTDPIEQTVVAQQSIGKPTRASAKPNAAKPNSVKPTSPWANAAVRPSGNSKPTKLVTSKLSNSKFETGARGNGRSNNAAGIATTPRGQNVKGQAGRNR